jgi:hypothetical protein
LPHTIHFNDYGCDRIIKNKRVVGIEPTTTAWKAVSEKRRNLCPASAPIIRAQESDRFSDR